MSDSWFGEKEVMWPGQQFSLQVERILFQGKSSFQDILVFDSTTYGRVLVLDGVIQLTERDECAYQEMIVNLPMMSHPQPRHVLIIGGGDGGVLREVCRHEGVETVVMCEIDEMVVELSKKYFSTSTATAFSDPRLTLKFEDAAKFIKSCSSTFDVIITDSSDPVGPANTLFTQEFYADLKRSLRPGGVLCCQGECMWLHLDLITSVMQGCRKIFPKVEYAYTSIPSYPSGNSNIPFIPLPSITRIFVVSGQIGFLICGSSSERDLRCPARSVPPSLLQQLKFYNSELHTASFTLPNFAKRKIDG